MAPGDIISIKLPAQPTQQALRRTIQVAYDLQVHFTDGVFDPANDLLGTVLAGDASAAAKRAIVVFDAPLLSGRPRFANEVMDWFQAHAGQVELAAEPIAVPGGEPVKNTLAPVTDLLATLERHHIDRHSFLIAVGGGALLDMAGFAAATAHRGVRHVRLPTTTLSQCDSGVGVKNGINAFGKKNFVGAFAPPFAVINDFRFIASLEPRDKRAGYSEAVKVGLIRDCGFFEAIEADSDRLCRFEPDAMRRLIRRSAELHLNQIATSGDPFELGSARPLDFGHWSAHKLEQLSGYAVRHGEAVAIGVAIDSIYSRNRGFLRAEECERILRLLENLGFTLHAPDLLPRQSDGRLAILAGLEEFREHLGGELTITLLRGLGLGFEAHEMDTAMVARSIAELELRTHAESAS